MAEEDKKYVGVVFRMHDLAGIARITITNTTTSTIVLSNKDVDLYSTEWNRSATPAQYNLWCFWWNVTPATDNYSISVALAPTTPTGRYIEVDHYLENVPITAGSVSTIMTTWHSTYPTNIYTYTLVTDTVTSLEKIYSIAADGTETAFALPTSYHAHDFKMYRTSTGDTWKYPTDIEITWGSNGVSYNDELIDATGKFGIKFYTAPIVGKTIELKYIPLVDQYRLDRTMKQPYTTGYIDYQSEVRLLDDAIELLV